MNVGQLFADAWDGLRRNMSMAVSVVLVTMISVVLLGMGMLAQRQADLMRGYWYDKVQVSIYLCTDTSTSPSCASGGVTEAQKKTIESQLDQLRPLVEEVYYESEQEAYDRFRQQFQKSSYSEDIKVGDIPQSYRVRLSDPSKYQTITSSFENAPGVSSVQDQDKIFGRIFKVLDGITWAALLMAAFTLVSAVLLMATTIRQAAFTRRREIGIMRLVGASGSAIRTPFLIEVVAAGLVGTVLGIGILWGLVRYFFDGVLSRSSNALISASDVLIISPWLILGVILLSVVTGSVTLWRSLRV